MRLAGKGRTKGETLQFTLLHIYVTSESGPKFTPTAAMMTRARRRDEHIHLAIEANGGGNGSLRQHLFEQEHPCKIHRSEGKQVAFAVYSPSTSVLMTAACLLTSSASYTQIHTPVGPAAAAAASPRKVDRKSHRGPR